MAEPFTPMKAVLSDKPFDDPNWIFERKLDGIRCGVVRRGGLVERKRALRRAVQWRGHLRWTAHRNGTGVEAHRDACRRGWEGVIAKRADSRYVATRSRDWLKLKCSRGQELVIGGWTAPKGTRKRLGALLLGYWGGDRLRYAGKVGTGFDAATLEWLGDELERR